MSGRTGEIRYLLFRFNKERRNVTHEETEKTRAQKELKDGKRFTLSQRRDRVRTARSIKTGLLEEFGSTSKGLPTSRGGKEHSKTSCRKKLIKLNWKESRKRTQTGDGKGGKIKNLTQGKGHGGGSHGGQEISRTRFVRETPAKQVGDEEKRGAKHKGK